MVTETLGEDNIIEATWQDITSLVPEGETLVLVDQYQWLIKEIDGRKVLPFLERDGVYWGIPADNAAAIAEIERQYERGIPYIVFVQPGFWYLDFYTGMRHYLDTRFFCIVSNERVVAYDLRKKKPSGKFANCISKPEEKFNLVIFDDFLPNLGGSWRAAEMFYYLKEMEGAQLVCMENFYGNDTCGMIDVEKTFESDKQICIQKYDMAHQQDAIVSLKNFSPVNVNTRLAYCLFIQNLREIYSEVLEKYEIPFVFTLYPGGSFRLNSPECDSFLQIINASPLFKGVIVTQQCTYDYLVDRNLVDVAKIKMIFGAPYELYRYRLPREKRFYKKNKDTLDVCFVSAKNITNGIDKGFDVFSQVAYRFSCKYNYIRFHVVGGFSKTDLLYDMPEGSIQFYGYRQPDWFNEFYCDIDIAVSPVKPHVLSWGAFDGFPTAALTEAGLFGAVMITSDPMGDNVAVKYKNWEEMIIAESNVYSIMDSIEKLINNPSLIEKIAANGKKRANEVYATDRQLGERLNFLKEKMAEE